MWPFRKREVRQSSYTDTLVRTIVEAAGASFASPAATGALEAAASIVSRSFAAADVQGDEAATAALGPLTRSLVGRALIRSGECVLVMAVRDGRVRLSPAASWDVTGDPDPRSWIYQVHLAGPSGQRSRQRVGAEGVIHLRYQVDPETPWRGVGPIQSAALAGRLSAETIEALADESSGPRGYLLAQPKPGDDPGVAALKADLRNLKGKVAVVQNQRALAAGAPASMNEWETTRIGARPDAALVSLAELASREVLAACGVPPVLVGERGDGTARREGYRQLLHQTVAPLGAIVSEELSAKLETPITLSFESLFAADLAGRARAFQSLVGAGLDLDRAASLSGLMQPEG